MKYIKAEKVKLFQQFAKKMKSNKEFEMLKMRPVNLKVPQKQTRARRGHAEKRDQSDYFINCEVVVKIFLKGTVIPSSFR